MNLEIYLRHLFNKMKKRLRYMSREKKRLWIVGMGTMIIGISLGAFIGGKVGTANEKKRAEEELVAVTAELKQEEQEKIDEMQKDLDRALGELEEKLPWNLVLVNFENKMEEGYEPELTQIDKDHYVDSRIAEAAEQMLEDAYDAGMRIIICSSYRSVERQEQVFNASMRERIDSGLNYWDAFSETRLCVAEPGTSEHALGLALDLISNQYTELDEGQEDTKEAKWLAENCHKYGFILRYPPEATEITGIIYEPWHYRYVGVEHATKIMELGITLEEYLEEYY